MHLVHLGCVSTEIRFNLWKSRRREECQNGRAQLKGVKLPEILMFSITVNSLKYEVNEVQKASQNNILYT